jgi:hypothetical protein
MVLASHKHKSGAVRPPFQVAASLLLSVEANVLVHLFYYNFTLAEHALYKSVCPVLPNLGLTLQIFT